MMGSGSRASRLQLTLAVAAFAALLWGSVSLQRTFIDERDDARAALSARHDALEQYAKLRLEKRFQEQLEQVEPRIDAALADPLRPVTGLLFIDNGRQKLPPVYQPLAGKERPTEETYKRLMRTAPDAEGAWGERLKRLTELQAALDARSESAITRGVRQLLDHETRVKLPVAQEFAARLFLSELLSQHDATDPALTRALLLDGLSGTRGRRIVGLQPLLLASSVLFTESDFAFLSKRVLELSRQARVPTAELEAALAARDRAPILVPDSMNSPSLINDGAWYVVPLEERGLRGVAVDVASELSEIAAEMRRTRLLAEAATIQCTTVGPLTALSDLHLDLSEDGTQLEQIDRRYLLKTGVGLALVLLLLSVAGLVGLLQRRKHRLLDAKAAFVASVTHELRTPLASLRLMGETLERRLGGNSAAKDFPTRIVREAERLNFLVENILTFNRLEKSRVRAALQPISVEELVAEAGPDAAVFAKTEVTVRVRSGGELTLRVDADLMRLLLSNLLSNACKYNERDVVQIEVTASVQGDRLTLLVSDNGSGISSADQPHIFTEFFRAQTATKTGGFGLGLALCRRIMELHDGTIRVLQSTREGTTFEMAFPKPAGEA